MVKTDRKVKEDMDINEAKDKKGKGSGSKDAVITRSSLVILYGFEKYASGAWSSVIRLVPPNWGNSTKRRNGRFL